MNKYLSEIEITASNSFGESNVLKFIDETRGIVTSINSYFSRNIRSNYGKYVVFLWPQNVIDEHSLPSFEYDDVSGVCIRNIPYDLNLYFDMQDNDEKKKIIVNILKNAFIELPQNVGLNGKDVIEVFNAAI